MPTSESRKLDDPPVRRAFKLQEIVTGWITSRSYLLKQTFFFSNLMHLLACTCTSSCIRFTYKLNGEMRWVLCPVRNFRHVFLSDDPGPNLELISFELGMRYESHLSFVVRRSLPTFFWLWVEKRKGEFVFGGWIRCGNKVRLLVQDRLDAFEPSQSEGDCAVYSAKEILRTINDKMEPD